MNVKKSESDSSRHKAYALVERRAASLSMPELKEALADFWQTYPDYDPRYLVKPRSHVWIKIPAGKVSLIEEYYDESYVGKKGESKVFDVPSFEIGKYPVTVAQYELFIQDGGYQNIKWWHGLAKRIKSPYDLPDFSRPDHPRVNVSWYESIAYCRWLSAKMGKNVRLLTEQEWQRAAQGDDNRIYPWGDEWEESRSNNIYEQEFTDEQEYIRTGNTTPVALYEGKDKGNSPYGVVDMVGNVSEWCMTAYETGSTDLTGDVLRVLRSCSWDVDQRNASVTYRFKNSPQLRCAAFGFRVGIVAPFRPDAA